MELSKLMLKILIRNKIHMLQKLMDKHLMIHIQDQVIHAIPVLIVTMVNVAQNGDIVELVIIF